MTAREVTVTKTALDRQQSMYELDSDAGESSDNPARSGRRRARGSRGGSHGRKTSSEATMNAILSGDPEQWNPEEMDAQGFNAALLKAPAGFMISICRSLKANSLNNSQILTLIVKDAWKDSGELQQLLKQFILEHPTDVSHICGYLIQANIISVHHRISAKNMPRPIHSYEADVTVEGESGVLRVVGAGPSSRVARTQAYQQLLLLMCGLEGTEVALTSAPLPWAELVATAGGIIPHATVLDEDDPHQNGYTAVATFAIGSREWRSTGTASPWKSMARQLALDALYEAVLTDLAHEGQLYCELLT